MNWKIYWFIHHSFHIVVGLGAVLVGVKFMLSEVNPILAIGFLGAGAFGLANGLHGFKDDYKQSSKRK